jgi:alanyl-tRNA synthetase
MLQLTTNQLRQYWLDFFHEHGHAIVDSSSVVPKDDPTILLINAGMNQFKDLFLGLEKRDYTRATTSQKCIRVSGKHNDLEAVGPSPRHHTFFEMLGNFSFGDYFKHDAINLAWELLVNRLGLDLDRLWFTVYADDDEAERLWIEAGAAPERVLRFGKKDNWWSMGDTGPCGPSSEIHYYWGDLDKQVPEGVNKDDEYLEIWNLVFMQYDQKLDGTIVPLPAPSVDTGGGLERIASILQGKQNNYDTDAFVPIMERIQQIAELNEEERQTHLYRIRAIADHARACAILVGDGVLPGNEGRNYVLRMILRRAARFGKLLGIEQPFMAQVVDSVIDELGGHYTDLNRKRAYILQTVNDEEERFHRTLNTGLSHLEGLMGELRAAGTTVIPGRDAFQLWDTYGFPVDLTRDIAADAGFTLDEAGFRVALAAAKEQSRATAQEKGVQDLTVYQQVLASLQDSRALPKEGVAHLIYENVERTTAPVLALIVNGSSVEEAHAGSPVELVLPETPFYVESGGQISDTGEIYYWPEDMDAPAWAVEITDTRRRIPGLIVHIGTVTQGTVRVGDAADATIDTERRWDIMRNHTATHVLQAALRAQLGDHVHQAGSLVAPDRLRFDFTHGAPLTDEDIRAIERFANTIILANYDVNTRWTTYKQAVEEGATALFGEKYGNEVRVVSFGEEEGVSMELCGGTHVDTTAEIGSFRTLGETSVAAGVRRIEVATGRGAEALIEDRFDVLQRIADTVRTKPADADAAVLALVERNHVLEREMAQIKQKIALVESASMLSMAVDIDGVKVLAIQADFDDVEMMRKASDFLRDRLGSGVVALGSVIDERPMLVVAVTPDLIARGMHAGNLVKAIAPIIGGGGGGKPNIAQAGGKDVTRMPDAIGAVFEWVRSNLK